MEANYMDELPGPISPEVLHYAINARLLKGKRTVNFVILRTQAGDYIIAPLFSDHTHGGAVAFCATRKQAKREAKRLHKLVKEMK
jgi:hypothetical protein